MDTAAEGADVEATLAAAIEEGYDALAQTTDMNPVLKKAGVVDAGGKGYLLILEGMLAELRASPSPEAWRSLRRTEKADFNAMAQEGITFTFDTVYGAQGPGGHRPHAPCGLTSAASATVWSLVRMTRPSRSTSIPDIPGAALTESQNTARWSWRRSRICALSGRRAGRRPDRPEH